MHRKKLTIWTIQ